MRRFIFCPNIGVSEIQYVCTCTYLRLSISLFKITWIKSRRWFDWEIIIVKNHDIVCLIFIVFTGNLSAFVSSDLAFKCAAKESQCHDNYKLPIESAQFEQAHVTPYIMRIPRVWLVEIIVGNIWDVLIQSVHLALNCVTLPNLPEWAEYLRLDQLEIRKGRIPINSEYAN